ncbi:MAG: peptidylprolyl isomerase [Nanoarchaeota archaeon]
MAIKKGDKIKVDYTGTLDDGTVFDSSEKHGQPLEFEAGTGKVIKGFDDAVIGMKKGDEKDIKINSADAYGNPDHNLVKQVPINQLPPGQEIKPGMMFLVGLPNGSKIPAAVKEVTKEEATINLNHPLAGKNLNFKIKIVDIMT